MCGRAYELDQATSSWKPGATSSTLTGYCINQSDAFLERRDCSSKTFWRKRNNARDRSNSAECSRHSYPWKWCRSNEAALTNQYRHLLALACIHSLHCDPILENDESHWKHFLMKWVKLGNRPFLFQDLALSYQSIVNTRFDPSVRRSVSISMAKVLTTASKCVPNLMVEILRSPPLDTFSQISFSIGSILEVVVVVVKRSFFISHLPILLDPAR